MSDRQRPIHPAPQGREPNPEAPPEHNPRAFATGTGFVLQTLGGFYCLGAVGVWTFSAWITRKAAEPATSWLHFLTGEQAPAALRTLLLWATLLVGLGMIAAGVGLQGERPASGRIAALVTGLGALAQLVLCVLMVLSAGAIAVASVAAVLGLLTGVLFYLSCRSAAVLTRHPPPPDQSVVTDEMLETFRREREERRRKSGL